MAKRVGMEVALAVAEAVGQCNIDMAAVYPITPQSHIGEHLSEPRELTPELPPPIHVVFFVLVTTGKSVMVRRHWNIID